MAKAKVTISWPVPAGYSSGDYAVLCSNDGLGGDIDFNNPVSGIHHDLFRRGAGIYGCFHTPAFTTRCYQASAMRTAGCFKTLCFKGPCFHGFNLITESIDLDGCGSWVFAFAVYDSLGNINEGDAEEITFEVHLAPDSPSKLSKVSYNKDTDILILAA